MIKLSKNTEANSEVYKNDDGKYWVESTQSGERGWLVDSEDSDAPVMPPFPEKMTVRVRLNRPRELLLKRYIPNHWRPLATASPLSEVAKANIAHTALRRLAQEMGDYNYARKEMIAMGETERMKLIKHGPAHADPTAANDIRQRLWDGIMDILNTVKS